MSFPTSMYDALNRHNLIAVSTASEPYPLPDVDSLRRGRKYNDPRTLEFLVECSIVEDSDNSQYSGILNTLANHTVGTVPIAVSLTESDTLNNAIEDRWLEFSMYNSVGAALREFRRKVAQVGLAILIPYRSNSDYDLKLAFKVVGREHFKSPYHDRRKKIDNGIEYDSTGDIKAVYIQEEGKKDPTRYLARPNPNNPKDLWGIIWCRKARPFPGFPECGPALKIYPSINRQLDNIARESEFKTSIPMAIELDPQIYKVQQGVIPKGIYKYEPGNMPTLPPGTKLTGLAVQTMAEDRNKLNGMFVSVAARCVDMPKILALASSSDSNMATAHIDLQPWKYVVDIDRFDYEVVVRRVYYLWYEMASMIMLPSSAVANERPLALFNYTVLFNHPDPLKCASARSIDLISGGSTLTLLYAEQGKSARREIEKECKLLGITKEKFYELILASRSKQSAEVLNPDVEENESEVKVNT